MNEDKKETPQSEENGEVSKQQAETVEAEVVETEKKADKKDRKKDKKKEADKSEELEKQLAAATITCKYMLSIVIIVVSSMIEK